MRYVVSLILELALMTSPLSVVAPEGEEGGTPPPV